MVLIQISTLYYFAQNKYFFLKDIYCIRENMFPPLAVVERGGGGYRPSLILINIRRGNLVLSCDRVKITWGKNNPVCISKQMTK